MPPSLTTNSDDYPTARESTGVRWSWVWLVPLLALLVVGYLAYEFLVERGPLIEVTFDTADGLNEGQTLVKYRAVALGTVESVELSGDLQGVVARVRMSAEAEPLLTDQARFWVVRPRLGGGLGALRTGLETLVSGTYVALDPGRSRGQEVDHFEGLEAPPSVRSDEPGKVFFLDAEALGGITVGAPIICREVEVGEVLGYELRPDRQVRFRIFVREPFDTWVTPHTRFWNAPGLSLTNGPSGLQLQIASAQSLFSGALAFHTPPSQEDRTSESSPAEASFILYPTRAQAELGFYDTSFEYVTYFERATAGLRVGAEVQLLGQTIGSVTGVTLTSQPAFEGEERFAARVRYAIQPGRALEPEHWTRFQPEAMQKLVEHGMRVVLETQNVLTGQQVLSLQFSAATQPPTGPLPEEAGLLVLPGEVRGFDQLVGSLGEVVSSISRIPFAALGEDAHATLVALRQTAESPALRSAIRAMDSTFEQIEQLAEHADEGLGPLLKRLPGMADSLERALAQAEQTLGKNGYGADSTLHRNVENMMREVGEAARSIRVFAEFLQVHPDSVLRGREANP